MWTALWVGRWMCLLTLAVAMLFSASEVESYDPIGLPCCSSVGLAKPRRIRACYEQTPREGCSRHAFLVVNNGGRRRCIDPAAEWLRDQIEKGELICPPVLR